MRSNAKGPLVGIRVVEIEGIGPLPLAGMMLADMGADCVRVTRPANTASVWDDSGGAILHRGRSAVEVDMKSDPHHVLDLITLADLFVEGMRPGVMERLGLGPDQCHAVNPRLVYGRITGWGQSGPRAREAGHDLNYVGLTGLLHAMGDADAPPPVPLNMVGDYGAGSMLLLTGVLAALLSAKSTGKGQVVDAAMTDGLAMQSAMFRAFIASRRWDKARASNLLDGAAPFYRCYRCADGRFVAVGALEPQFYYAMLNVLDLPAEKMPQHDQSQWPQMAARLASTFASRSQAEWETAFNGIDACVTPVRNWDEALDDAHMKARNSFVAGPGGPQPSPAPRFSVTPSAIGPEGKLSVEQALARWMGERRD